MKETMRVRLTDFDLHERKRKHSQECPVGHAMNTQHPFKDAQWYVDRHYYKGGEFSVNGEHPSEIYVKLISNVPVMVDTKYGGPKPAGYETLAIATLDDPAAWDFLLDFDLHGPIAEPPESFDLTVVMKKRIDDDSYAERVQ